jgi:hypothetical protein
MAELGKRMDSAREPIQLKVSLPGSLPLRIVRVDNFEVSRKKQNERNTRKCQKNMSSRNKDLHGTYET